jgi:formylglycine-generating enzyme required for sulfatase activity
MSYDPSPEMNDPRQSSELPVTPIFPYPSVNRFSNAKQRGEFCLLRSEHGSLMIFRQQGGNIRFLREIGSPAVDRFDYLASRQWLLLGRGPTLFIIDLPSGRELARKECNGNITGIVCWNDKMLIAFANTLAEVELSYGGKVVFVEVTPYPESIIDMAATRAALVVLGANGTYDGQGRKTGEFVGMDECIELQGTIYLRRGRWLYSLNGQIFNNNQTVKISSTCLLSWPGQVIPANMIVVEGGKFEMGASDCGDDAKPPHSVELSRFLIGKYPVTFAEYDAYCQAIELKYPSDNAWGRGPRPVIDVSWQDAIAYCNWRSHQDELTIAYDAKNGTLLDYAGKVTADTSKVHGYRLATEAEWEYAARGGQKSQGYAYSGSNSLAEVGWYHDNAVFRTQPVGEKKENELGIYDMSGNLSEWCQDWYAKSYYATSPTRNPMGPTSGSERVTRGYGFLGNIVCCRSTYRGKNLPNNRGNLGDLLGFRLCRSFP